MAEVLARTGNEVFAEAMRQIEPDVVAAYPITPATEIVQIFSSFVADGLVKTEFVAVESEHSAMSAVIGASAAGARAMTGTSSQGLMLMAEMLPIASALRLPIVMAVVNRAISGPINIHCDHSDTMFVRDSGWIQIYAENCQEAYDNMLQAVKIAEKIKLPVMVSTDGFIISHGMEGVEIFDDKTVKDYVGPYQPATNLLDTDNPITVGSLDLQDYYFEHKRPIAQAMIDAKKVILDEAKAFKAKFGRSYDMVEAYKLDDAEIAIVVIGSTAGTAKDVIDELRAAGVKAGMLKIRVYRPFPHEDIVEKLKKLKAVAVMDRVDAYNGFCTPTYMEVSAALQHAGVKLPIINYVYGLGGRDVSLDHIRQVFTDLGAVASGKKTIGEYQFIGLRE
ncbi:MAG: pyruvate ferredoxin oxidoreductase [bacterium]